MPCWRGGRSGWTKRCARLQGFGTQAVSVPVDVADAQQTEEPENPSRPDNLREPVKGDYGTHGRFDCRAKNVMFKSGRPNTSVGTGLRPDWPPSVWRRWRAAR